MIKKINELALAILGIKIALIAIVISICGTVISLIELPSFWKNTFGFILLTLAGFVFYITTKIKVPMELKCSSV